MGGMETYSKRLSEELEAFLSVDRMVLKGHQNGSVPTPLELIGFGIKTAFRLLFARRPADVTLVADMASWPLAFCARLRNARGRVVLAAHGTDVAYPSQGGVKGRLYGAYLRLGARLLGNATVIANSAATARCVESFGYRDTAVVPLAAEIEEPPKARTQGTAVLFAGRLVPRKGCAWFIREVLPLLPEPLTLNVAGAAWDAEEVAALDHPRVRYLGILGQQDLWQAYADALCVIAPNIELENGQFEGFGLVATEAAAAGGIVLAARHAGLCEAVSDTKTGFLLPPADPIAWSEKIWDVAGWSAHERSEFVRRSKAICAERYTWERVAKDTLAVIDHARCENFHAEVAE